MCGFIGVMRPKGGAMPHIEQALCTLKHRGPDARGSGSVLLLDHTVHLGHVRLSIIDPETEANQPMVSPDGRLCVVFNGEIYNYKELRHRLIQSGRRFQTASDTEVILHLYEQEGMPFIDSLRGMFAIAIIDTHTNRVVLIRDRFGKKPLYYYRQGNRFIFSSEIKGILSQLDTTPDIELQAMRDYFSLLAPTPPRTFFKGISKLAAGHYMVIENGIPNAAVLYYDPLDHLNQGGNTSVDDLEALLTESVQYRLVSDVEVGVFLSGGLDSSLVAALYNRFSNKRFHTFSIGYCGFGERYDETPFAKTVAAHIHSEHHPLQVGQTDFIDTIEQVVYHLDEPINDPAAIPTYLLSKWVKAHDIKVCLSGEGSDEIFMGYSVYELLRRLYQGAWRFNDKKTASDLFVNSDKADLFQQRINRHTEPYRTIGEYFALPEESMSSLLNPQVLAQTRGPHDALDRHFSTFRSAKLDSLNWASYIDLKHWIAEVLMMKVDKMAMAHGVEVRIPFLDRRLVECAFSMPISKKLGKQVIKQVAARHLPESIVNRRKKGFSSPFLEWLYAAHGNEILNQLRKLNQSRNWFLDDALVRIFEQGKRGQNKHAIWGLYLIARWCERYDMV